MSSKETFDKIFETLLDEAIQNIEAKPDIHLPEERQITFSKEHEEKMQKLFDKERSKIRKKSVLKIVKYMAACISAFIIVLAITIMSVSAFRVRFLNFIFDTSQTYTEIRPTEDENKSDYNTDGVSIGYIPDGFLLDKKKTNGDMVYFKFKNNEEYFSISICGVNSVHRIDTENADMEMISINGYEGLYSENQNGHILTVHDDAYIYTISGNIQRQEIVEIAQNLKKY